MTTPPGVPPSLLPELPVNTKFFDGEGQLGNWSDPLNWWNDAVPAASATVLIPVNATLNGTFTVHQIMMLGNEQVTINGTLNTTSLGLCTNFMVCNDAVVTFTATSTLNDASGLIVGNDSVGTLIAQGTQSGYSTLHTVATKIGRFAGSNGTMTIDGAHWDDTQSLFVGLSGTGTLNVLDGGQVAIGTSMVIGRNVGATGAVSLASGADVSVGSWLKVGGGDTTMAGGTGSLAVGATAVLNAAGPLVIEPGSDVTLTGGSITLGASGNGLVVSAGSNLSGFGAVTTTTDSIFDAGTITATGGTLALSGAVAGGGVLQIGADSTLRITGASIGKLAISFSGADGSLDLAHGVHDSAILAGFAAGDTLAMAGINSIAWNSSSDILTLSANGQVVDTLKFAGSYSAGQFTLTQSGGEAIIGLTTAH